MPASSSLPKTSRSTIALHRSTLLTTDSDRQPEQERMNCAQFVSGQPGPELPALRFKTDPICLPLSCSARLDQKHHAQTMYNDDDSFFLPLPSWETAGVMGLDLHSMNSVFSVLFPCPSHQKPVDQTKRSRQNKKIRCRNRKKLPTTSLSTKFKPEQAGMTRNSASCCGGAGRCKKFRCNRRPAVRRDRGWQRGSDGFAIRF